MSVSRFTVEEYHQLGERGVIGKRTELIRGIIFEKERTSPLHSTTASRIHVLLWQQSPPGFEVRKEDPLTFADSEPEPNVSIVRGNGRDYQESHPQTAVLVVEVSVTTLEKDRALASLYAEADVEEYWILIPRERRVEVYRRPVGGSYLETSTVGGDAVLICSALPCVRIALADLFS